MLKINYLSKSDWQSFYCLWKQIFAKDFLSRYNQSRKNRLKKKLSKKKLKKDFLSGKRKFLVAKKDNQIIGFIIFKIKKDYSWASWMAVNEDFRRQGIGRALLKKWAQIAKQNSLTSLRLQTSIFTSQKFYKKIGFYKIGQHQKEGLTFIHFENKI